MRKIIVDIGYESYAMSEEDFMLLSGIAARAVHVDMGDYRLPYRPRASGTQKELIYRARLENFDPTPLPGKEELIEAAPRPQPLDIKPDEIPF